MTREVIYEDDEILVLHRPGASAFTVVTFAALTHRPQGDWIWAGPPIEKLDLDAVGFIGKRENWYPAASMRAAAPAVRALLRPQAVGYGYSMGGYAVLKYGRLLGLTHGLAVSPQVSIDRAEVPWERRFQRFRDPALHAGMITRPGEAPPIMLVAGDPGWELDGLHLRTAMTQGARLVALPFMRHAAIDRFTSSQVLEHVLALVLAGDAAGVQSYLRGRRADSVQWHIWLGREAEARGHRFAAWFWEGAARLGARPTQIAIIRGAAAQERLVALWVSGQRGKARRLADATIEAQGGQAAGLVRLGELLMRYNMPMRGIHCFRKALKAAPHMPAAHLGLLRALQRTKAKVAFAHARTAALRMLAHRPDDRAAVLALEPLAEALEAVSQER